MRALSNRVLDALRADGAMSPDDLAVTLREPVEAIRRTLAQLPPGEVTARDSGQWAVPQPVEPEPEPPAPPPRKIEYGSIVDSVRASLRSHGPQTTAEIAERLGLSTKRISTAAAGARDIIGDREGAIYRWRLAGPDEAPRRIADPIRWLPCPARPRTSQIAYRGYLVLGGVRDEGDEARWWVGCEDGRDDRPATGYAPDAAAARRAVEACAEAIGFGGVGADGAVWGSP